MNVWDIGGGRTHLSKSANRIYLVPVNPPKMKNYLNHTTHPLNQYTAIRQGSEDEGEEVETFYPDLQCGESTAPL